MTGSSIEVVVCGLDFSDEEGGAKSELHQWCQCNWVSDIFLNFQYRGVTNWVLVKLV